MDKENSINSIPAMAQMLGVAALLLFIGGFKTIAEVNGEELGFLAGHNLVVCPLVALILVISCFKYYEDSSRRWAYKTTVWLGNVHWIMLALKLLSWIALEGHATANALLGGFANVEALSTLSERDIAEIAEMTERNWLTISMLVLSAVVTLIPVLAVLVHDQAIEDAKEAA